MASSSSRWWATRAGAIPHAASEDTTVPGSSASSTSSGTATASPQMHHHPPPTTDAERFTSAAADILLPPRATSPAPSVYSVTSSIREKFFRNINGRIYGNRGHPACVIPADNEENLRNESFHNLLKMARNGKNYVGPVRRVLRPSAQFPDKAALDLGCGTALWIREVSQEFPHAEFMGVDILPIQPSPLPPNCRVEVDDFNLNLNHFYNSFDLVHTRVIASGVQNYPRLIDQIAQILRPSGMILLQDTPYLIHNSTHEILPIPLPPDYVFPNLPSTKTDPNFVYTAFWYWVLRQAFAACDGHVDAAFQFRDWLEAHESFEEVETKVHWIPIGPWFEPSTNSHEWAFNYLGEMKRRDILAVFSGTRQMLLTHGMSIEDWEELETHVVQELTTDCARLKLVEPMISVWARKKSAVSGLSSVLASASVSGSGSGGTDVAMDMVT